MGQKGKRLPEFSVVLLERENKHYDIIRMIKPVRNARAQAFDNRRIRKEERVLVGNVEKGPHS